MIPYIFTFFALEGGKSDPDEYRAVDSNYSKKDILATVDQTRDSPLYNWY